MSMEDALDTFIAEARELLEQMESALLRLGDGDNSAETMNEIFRAAHTIKGSSGLFGLNDIVSFTHKVENILDRAREANIVIDDNLLTLLLKCGDHIGVHVDAVVKGISLTEEQELKEQQLVQALQPWLEPDDMGTTTAVEDDSSSSSNQADLGCWHLSIRLSQDSLRNGMDPLSIFKFLQTLGEFQYLYTLHDELPERDNFSPESLYLSFELGLQTDASRETIDDSFMFVREDANITLVPPRSAVDEYIKLIKTTTSGQDKLGEILLACGAITGRDLDSSLNEQTQQLFEEGIKTPLGSLLVDEGKVPAVVVKTALEQQQEKQVRGSATRFIRVDAERVDQLINLIGELVVSRQRVDLLCEYTSNDDLEEAVDGMGGITEQIRDAALNLRMVSIGETFQRFKRVVRDTAGDLGKDIELVLEGSETELDRSMVESLVDPLTHIVRNSIDHGIEQVEVRLERDKPARGQLKLAAFHEAGNIVIEVSDDGGGLNTERIRQKAIDNGVINANETLSERDIHQLIFDAGLSTADAVTNLSGRGVGMDVVRRNIESLQGTVDIASSEGEGTTMRIRLPLTLAIIDGFHVSAYGTHFIIPQNTILECMDFNSVEHVLGRNSINLRGELVPYLELKSLFALYGDKSEPEKLVVVSFGSARAAIVVDVLHGEIQTVIKPLGPIFQSLKGIGGSSLLGSGEVAFILDIPQLINSAVTLETKKNGLSEDMTP